jgi:hypothetical protein
MSRAAQRTIVAAIALAGVACNEANSPSQLSSSIASAFLSAPVGFDAGVSSFGGTGGSGPFVPERHGGPGGGRGEGGGGMGFFMGGGLGPEFFGGVGFGRGFAHGPFGGNVLPSECTFSSASGRVTCPTTTDHGLTIDRSAAYTDAAGNAQAAPDSTTNTVNLEVSVSGTVTRHDSATSTIQHTSDRTVSGLATGSSQRTVNGTSKGSETTTGTSDEGAFTALRVAGDTTKGVIVPIADGKPTYPTAGTLIRAMKVTVTITGQTPTTSERREVVTYDGSNTAKVTITQDGTTKTCTMPLPFGRLSCQ